jgi:lauroyl/myristoyl acyltransferase
MSLSRHLQTSGLLSAIAGMAPDVLKNRVMKIGTEWYSRNPDERDAIIRNLSALGLDTSPQVVDEIERHTILHYFEKFLPLTGDIASYASYLKNRIDGADAVAAIRTTMAAARGACIATAHFGAVEFIVPYLAMHRLPLNGVLRFTTEELSAIVHKRAAAMADSGLFGPISFIEIGKPKTVAAMQMAAALRRGEIVLSVFDEKTPYSKPVDLFGRKVWGGAGLDKMMDFANTPADLYVAFMIRNGQEQYRLELRKIDECGAGRIDAIYRTLESMVKNHLEQWYFLHEEIPFVEAGQPSDTLPR